MMQDVVLCRDYSAYPILSVEVIDELLSDPLSHMLIFLNSKIQLARYTSLK